MHSVWSRVTNEALAKHGLDFFTSYVGGRAAALGEPATSVVVSAFAVFSPDLIGPVYEAARAACPRDQLIETRTSATIASLTAAIAPAPGGADVSSIADTLQAAVSSADATARPLFAGFQGQPWPSDPMGRLWHACELAREHRGDSHNAACIAAGLGPVAMNIITELWVGMPFGTYSASRGWTPSQLAATADQLRAAGWIDGDQLSAEGHDRRNAIEATTDAMQQSIVDAIGPGFDEIVLQLDAWSQRCIDAAAFPPNAFKRAAG